MKIIKILPSKRFGGGWKAFEAPGVEPCYVGPNAKDQAIGYAVRCRFGGSEGEVHVYDEAGENVIENIPINDRGKYPQAERF